MLLTTVVFILAITRIIFPFSMKPGSPKPKRLFITHISREGLIDGNMPENYIWVMADDWLSLQPILDWKSTSLEEAKVVECDKTKVIRDCHYQLSYHYTIESRNRSISKLKKETLYQHLF